MKILKHSLILICISILLISGCKKYPDGPMISLRTKEHRLVGTWDVESFKVNGNDSTDFLKSQVFYGSYKFQDGEYGIGDFLFNGKNGSTYNTSGHWFFRNNKKDLEISINTSAPGSPHIGPFLADDVFWEIRRLKEKELWLQTTYNSKVYFIKFKLQK